MLQNQEIRIGEFNARLDRSLSALDEQEYSRRLWAKDASLWKQDAYGDRVILNRLGWLNAIHPMIDKADDITGFTEEVKNFGFKRAVLMGMGGSSLCPEVSRSTFGVKGRYLDLTVLDSTVPASVETVENRIDLQNTLFIVSTKSGTTVETLSAYRYFYEKLKGIKGNLAGENFIAITDPGTPLEKEADDKAFRRVFLNFPDIGGRYSALSYFGMVPAALIGADIKSILQRAHKMAEACGSEVQPSANPGVILGAVIAELAIAGRDKLTLILSPEIRSLGYWIEQLVAESTGKNGKGIIPVDSEPIYPPESYGEDRLFIYIHMRSSANAETDAHVEALEHGGHPVVKIPLDDVYDIGAEYFRWEVATAVASAILGVNAFDEPNVKESKDNTNRLLNSFNQKGALPEDKPIISENGISLFCNAQTQAKLDSKRMTGDSTNKTLLSYIEAFLQEFQPGKYFALMAFIHPTEQIEQAFSEIRGKLLAARNAATTLGYGPRFLHSTGQIHKGGPNTGVFIQFTADDDTDIPIPGQSYSFSILKQAQALGDAIALQDRGKPLIRLHLGRNAEQGLMHVLDILRKVT